MPAVASSSSLVSPLSARPRTRVVRRLPGVVLWALAAMGCKEPPAPAAPLAPAGPAAKPAATAGAGAAALPGAAAPGVAPVAAPVPKGAPAIAQPQGGNGGFVRDGGAGGSSQPRLPKLTATSSGADIYGALCAACHAVDLGGGAADHAPSLANPTFLESASDAFLKSAIAHGRPGTSMGAYGKAMGGPLDDASLARLVAFIRLHGPSYRPPSEKISASADAVRGAPLYASLCKSCHGDADVHGEAVHLANAGFLRDASDAFIKHAIVHGRPGTKMVPWGETVLAEPQVDDLVAYVRSFAKSQPRVSMLPAPTGHEPMVLNPRGKDPEFKIREDQFVGVDQVHEAFAAHRRMIIIDARPPSEWMQVHIQGAVSVPYHDMRRLDEVPQDVWVIAYCACPHHLSGAVVAELWQRGHKRALVLDEGINEWHRRGYPVVAAPGVQKPPAAAPIPGAPGALPVPGQPVPAPGPGRPAPAKAPAPALGVPATSKPAPPQAVH